MASERVRDKIAASKQPGIWMGGMPPLGYDIVDRKIVPNAEETNLVEEIFRRFAFIPSIATLTKDLRARGVTSKSWSLPRALSGR